MSRIPRWTLVTLAAFLATVVLGYAGILDEASAVCLGSLLPTLAWVAYVRSWDYREPEPLRTIGAAFLIGAISVIPAILAEIALETGSPLVDGVLVAPMIEELVKPLGLYALWMSAEVDDELDVMFYAATSAMGFAWVENLFAGLGGLSEMGIEGWAIVATGRGLMSTVGHAADSSVMGLGLGRLKFSGEGGTRLLRWYGGAVVLHAGWNWLVDAAGYSDIALLGLFAGPLFLAKLLSRAVRAAYLRSSYVDYKVVSVEG